MIEATRVGPAPTDAHDVQLVFLHEGLGTITTWRDTPAVIAQATNTPAFVYARPGYGGSSPVALPRPLTYMHDEAARLPALLAAANIHDVVLVGHSDGASIAIIAAGAELVVAPRAIVAIAPHVFVEDISVESIARAADAYRTGLRDKLARHHTDVDNAVWGWNRAWLDPAFRSWDLRMYLPRITAPMLVLQGDRDEYGTRAQVDAIATSTGGRVEVAWIDGAGHAPFRDAPDRVHDRIARFVADVRGETVTGPA